ncbi:hypothetical protein [Celeribacter ethanolicus]|uniref:hypothetical protein n=1 Tax=Celeribacter ethanolicus TaxID=1758178 RepID=UPI00082D31D7|nr:hypothetical protein [Celeribacter ethanolicus]
MKRLALLLPLVASPAFAAEIAPCDWRASSAALVEPWEDNSRSFANGAIRVALLDTVEPAAAAFHLLILTPPYTALGERQCHVISAAQDMGYLSLDFAGLNAHYDPATGLTLDLPGERYEGEEALPVTLTVRIDQSAPDLLVSEEVRVE